LHLIRMWIWFPLQVRQWPESGLPRWLRRLSSGWRLSWEGKSAAIILDDADLPAAVKGTVAGCFLNSGQTCNALSRMLVPEHLYEHAAWLAVEAARGYLVGDPLADQTRLGTSRFRAAAGKG
jgi:acyl-CoA reductase-like NAD-dependent aldehyde dehydrogenase